jgi:mono/diheme cytochrome c family protein
MRRCFIAIIAVLIITAPLAVSKLGHSQAQAERKGDVEAGRARYMKSCKSCHGEKGEGNPNMYKVLKATVVHLGSKEAQQKSDAEISQIMVKGYGKMKPQTGLTSGDVENILAFVRTLKQE